MPYLDACVQEALRLVPPVAAGEDINPQDTYRVNLCFSLGPPRWNQDLPTQILDHIIPARTTVAPPNYAIFRDRMFIFTDSRPTLRCPV